MWQGLVSGAYSLTSGKSCPHCSAIRGSQKNNGRIYIALENEDSDLYADVTINLSDMLLPDDDYIFINRFCSVIYFYLFIINLIYFDFICHPVFL